MPRDKVECDFDCLHCSLSDCERSTRDVAKQAVTRRKKRETYAKGSWNYAYMANVPEPDYTIGLVTTKMDRAELEAMLATQYGRKLEPVRAK